MSTDQMRSEFEAWFKPQKEEMMRNGASLLSIKKLHKSSWEAWQASRAALVVEIPAAMGAHQVAWEGDDWNMMREHAANAIRAAGITVQGRKP
ncbi:hypothetical protein [Dickeya poaceiphila]|uniref:Uncharacterized protein n=1 Tax=Dickeya poaceiphila TaxID=568768 RepID=A0A5B8HJN8_9GAMM|nr:hypothetical protein [Dickeya poaceiphila]QDX29526.1 hypothetical protein Dpoa569_0001301 [Dickeya poaceiphila]